MPRSELVGYVRRARDGKTLMLSLSVAALAEAERYRAQDGPEWVRLVLDARRATEILAGDREVSSVCQLRDDPPTLVAQPCPTCAGEGCDGCDGRGYTEAPEVRA